MGDSTESPLVSVIMGSKSDFEVMKHASDTLEKLDIAHEVRVLSAHRTPDAAIEFAQGLQKRGVRVLIAAAGGAAHLAGVMAGKTMVPVLGVPMQTPALGGMDSLLSTVQMPAGIPVATFAIGKPGAINAALFAAAMLAGEVPKIRDSLTGYRTEQTKKVLAVGDPRN